MLDDTCYFLPCSTAAEAAVLAALCNDPITLAFLRSASFKTAKRPITKALLQRIDLAAILRRTDRRALRNALARFKNENWELTPGKAIPDEIDRLEQEFERMTVARHAASPAERDRNPFRVPDRNEHLSVSRHSGPKSGERSLMKHLQIVVGMMLIGLDLGHRGRE